MHLTTAERNCQSRLCRVCSAMCFHRPTNGQLCSSGQPQGLTSALASYTFPTPPSLLTETCSFGSSPTVLARTASRSAAPRPRSAAESDGSQLVVTSNSGRVSAVGRPFSPTAAANWSATSCQSGLATPGAARGFPSCRRSASAIAALHSIRTDGSSAVSSSLTTLAIVHGAYGGDPLGSVTCIPKGVVARITVAKSPSHQ